MEGDQDGSILEEYRPIELAPQHCSCKFAFEHSIREYPMERQPVLSLCYHLQGYWHCCAVAVAAQSCPCRSDLPAQDRVSHRSAKSNACVSRENGKHTFCTPPCCCFCCCLCCWTRSMKIGNDAMMPIPPLISSTLYNVFQTIQAMNESALPCKCCDHGSPPSHLHRVRQHTPPDLLSRHPRLAPTLLSNLHSS